MTQEGFSFEQIRTTIATALEPWNGVANTATTRAEIMAQVREAHKQVFGISHCETRVVESESDLIVVEANVPMGLCPRSVTVSTSQEELSCK